MFQKTGLTYRTFLSIAEASGLDPEDPHMKELYRYLREILPGLKRIEEIDLAEIEPMPFPPHPHFENE